ncbi:MAG: DNA repair protein RecN [Proteobacteria bacterium]|nr:DNA repair protein RecN [Pseudomonadota bacterium]
MLKRLFIQNLATIEKQIVEFNTGFTALTGETGAGKSVLIKALRLILGEKCPKDLIRTGKEFLSVEAEFNIDTIPPVVALLEEMDVEHEGELIVRRKVHMSGKNSIYLNDHTINLNKLVLFAEHLVDLHGQHSQQSLLMPVLHIRFLDEFAGIQERVGKFSQEAGELSKKRKDLAELQQNAADRNREIDFLRFQISEIDEAGFSADEESALYEDARLLANGEQLINSLTPIADWNSDEHSPLAVISSSLGDLQQALKLDEKLEPVYKEMQSGLISLEEASNEITGYVSKLEVNPQRLEQVNSRLSELDALKRKYGNTLEEIYQYKDEQQQKLDKLENREFSSGELGQEIEEQTKKLLEEAKTISGRRLSAKASFEKTIIATLKELGMEQSSFEIELKAFVPKSENDLPFNGRGIDLAEFLIATNPGTPLKPLSKIASGGELSRIMLAIKTALNYDISFGSMVFDEVDSGISGRVAETVGEKLTKLGESRQILCITHSPQIAAKAIDHLKVEKVVENNASKTLIHRLEQNDRIEEIAQFLAGNEISDKTRAVASDMLSQENRN